MRGSPLTTTPSLAEVTGREGELFWPCHSTFSTNVLSFQEPSSCARSIQHPCSASLPLLSLLLFSSIYGK